MCEALCQATHPPEERLLPGAAERCLATWHSESEALGPPGAPDLPLVPSGSASSPTEGNESEMRGWERAMRAACLHGICEKRRPGASPTPATLARGGRTRGALDKTTSGRRASTTLLHSGLLTASRTNTDRRQSLRKRNAPGASLCTPESFRDGASLVRSTGTSVTTHRIGEILPITVGGPLR